MYIEYSQTQKRKPTTKKIYFIYNSSIQLHTVSIKMLSRRKNKKKLIRQKSQFKPLNVPSGCADHVCLPRKLIVYLVNCLLTL